METLNEKQAKKLFDANSVYIGGHDVVPINTAKDLFGENACLYVLEKNEARYIAEYYHHEDDGFVCLTYGGFMNAVSYYNSEMITKR